MSFITKIEKELQDTYKELGYEIDKVIFVKSNRKDLGDYQLNDAMKLAKIYHKSPIIIANEIVEKLKEKKYFKEVSVAGSGFINITLSDEYLIECVNELNKDLMNNIDVQEKKKIILDYGGANVAKALHVGHLRSANIGEALKRLAVLLGNEVIGDTHLGDSGLQAGIVVKEMMERFPDLPCFKADYDGSDFDLPIKKEDLKVIYPEGSKKSKEDEEYLEKARQITFLIQRNHLGYSKLWDKITELSKEDIKEIYKRLNATFELWEGERDSFVYIDEMLDHLKKQNLLYSSEGAVVMDVKEEGDELEVPPIILEKSDGAYLYSTTDLATIYGRMKRFSPDEIWYVVDSRQSLHFKQVIRAARKGHIIDDETVVELYGFGTMNGEDGKPFKTRNGGVMSLEDLITLVKDETTKRINHDIVEDDKVEETSEIIAISALKYADLLPFRSTDYVFNPEKFSDLEGKTGPYLLYSTIRMKSLLTKAKEQNESYQTFKTISNKETRDIIITLFDLPTSLNKSYEAKSLNEVADYIYRLTSVYNKFYAENKVLIEENKEIKESWLVLSKVVYDTNKLLLDVLGLKCPEKM